MINQEDMAHLDESVQLAMRGLFTTTPNPRVGCVIVRDGQVLGRGWHQWHGQDHAEIRAIQDAGGDIAGATLYVSLEPCSIQGETPPCTEALIASAVSRVVVGALDPDPRVNGNGLQRLKAAGLQVELADQKAAVRLNACHRHRIKHGRPWVRIKLASSLDGRTAMASGESQWITGPKARRDGQYWRARSCAVVTGVGTLLADDPRLNVRDEQFAVDGRLRQPLRVIIDSQLRTRPEANIFKESGPILIAHAQDEAQRQTEAEQIQCGHGSVDLERLLHLLGQRPCNEVLVEAGPTLAGALMANGFWDELLLYLAPKFLGATARPLLGVSLHRLDEAIGGRIIDAQSLGPDLRLRIARA